MPTGAAAPRLPPLTLGTAAGEPSTIAREFKALSPIRAPHEYSALGSAVRRSLNSRREIESANPPTAEFRPAPAELAARGAPRPAAPSTPIPASTPLPTAAAGAPPPALQPHVHAGAPPEVAGVEQTGVDLDRIPENDDAQAQAYLRNWRAHFLGNMPTSDAGVNTDPGPSPTLRLDGEADPAEIAKMKVGGRGQLEAKASRQALERDQDFGEDDIAPDLEPETVVRPVPAGERPGEPRCPKAEQIEPYRFDQQDEAELAQRARPQIDGLYDAEIGRLGGAEDERDTRITRAREDGARNIESLHDGAHGTELRMIENGRRQVANLRGQWAERDAATLTDFDGEVDPETTRVSGDITDRATRDQGEIDGRRDEVKKQAEDAKRANDTETEKVRQEGQKESGSWLSRAGRWIKNQVKRLASWASEKISQLFKALRDKLKQWFDDFKEWALDMIEKARRWVVDQLEKLRGWLHEKVEKYLGRFPAVARVFHGAIDAGIDFTQATVNATAEGLKKTVTWVVDGIAKAVDTALALVEGVAQLALWGFCNAVVLGVNVVVLLVDQDIEALIELIRDLPEPAVLGPLWPAIKYALLGYLERIRDKPADEKKRYARKTREVALSLSYYGGAFLGILQGFIWDGLIGLVRMLYDIVFELPKALYEMYNRLREMFSDVEAIEAMVAEARALWDELQAFLARPDAKEQIIAFLKSAPAMLHGMVREINRQVRGWAYGAGAKAADQLYAFVLNNSPFDIGLKVGNVVGQVLFEVALLFFTGGIGNLVKWGGKALQVFARAGKLVTNVAKGGGMILRMLAGLRNVVMAGVRIAQRVGKALRGVMVRLERLIARVFDWLKRGLTRVRGKLPKAARPRAGMKDVVWRDFVLAVRALAASYAGKGVKKAVLRARVQELARVHRAGVSGLIHIGDRNAHWTIWAKPKGFRYLRPRYVARALMDSDARWDAGRKAVLKAIRRLKRRPGNIGSADLRTILRPIQTRFRYSSLVVKFEARHNVFEIEGSMSPGKTVARTAPELDDPNKLTPTSNGAVMDNLAYRSIIRSPASGTPQYWPEVQKILAPPKYKVPPYVKGHLISGWFAPGVSDNLTPITRAANTDMEHKIEGPLRRKVPTKLGLAVAIGRGRIRALNVYKYTVKKVGRAALPAPLRDVIGSRAKARVPEESDLPKQISMTVVKKRYDDSARRWVDTTDAGDGIKSPATSDNVPPYPPGKIKKP